MTDTLRAGPQTRITLHFAVRLKDGTEKKVSMQTEIQVINKPVKKSKMVLKPIGMEDATSIAMIRIGDDAWLDAGSGTWIHMPAQQVEDMVGNMLMDTKDTGYIGKELRKGTKKIGPMKCTVYKFTKEDILRLSKKYSGEIAPDEVMRMENIDKMEGETCVTKNGLVLEYHMEIVSSDPTKLFGMDLSSFNGVNAEDVKEAVFSVDERVSDINAKFDIKPPAGG